MIVREKCCNKEILKPYCKVGIPPIETGTQAYVKKLWTGNIMINFSNKISRLFTPIYGYVYMKSVILEKKKKCVFIRRMYRT